VLTVFGFVREEYEKTLRTTALGPGTFWRGRFGDDYLAQSYFGAGMFGASVETDKCVL